MFSPTTSQVGRASTPNPMQTPSQSTQKLPRVFVAADGSSLPVFVDSNGVTRNRPKLVRTLRSAGAEICTEVLLARIILVDPDTNEGRQFVRDWSLDPGKCILNYAWVYRCIDAGRALLENDNWGGCGNLDGTPLDGNIDDDEKLEGPSTSRSNRAAASTKKSVPQRQESPHNDLTSSVPSSLPTPRPTPALRSQTTQDRSMDNPTDDGTHSRQAHPTPPPIAPHDPSYAPHFLPQASPPPHVQTQTHLPTLNIHQNSSLPSPSPYDMTQGAPQHYPIPLQQHAMNLMNNPDLMAAAAMLLQQQQMAGMTGMNTLQNPSGAQFLYSGPQAWPAIQHPSMLPPQMLHSSMSPPQQYYQPAFTNGPTIPPEQNRMITPPVVVKSEPRMPSITSEPVTSEPSRISDSPTPSEEERSVLTQTAKRRSSDSRLPSGPKSKRVKRDSETRSASMSKISEDGSNYGEHKTRPSKRERKQILIDPPLRPEPSRKESKTIGIFTDPKGEPMSFFVQVDMRNRVSITGMVKKNGGKITSSIEEAAFIILTSQSKSTKSLLKEVKIHKRYALQQDFVKACVEEGAIVDETEYIFEPEPSAYQRRKLEEAQKPASTPGPSPIPQVHGPRDRSPTPPTKIEELHSGRHAFTREDKDYIRVYAAHLFRQAPQANLSVLIRRIAERAPQHSASSWQRAVYTAKDELEQIREQSIVEKRQAEEVQAEEANVEAAIGLSGNEGPSNGHPLVGAAVGGGVANVDHEALRSYESKEETDPADIQEDMKNIVEYFANATNGTNDEQLWAELHEKFKCRTSSCWQDFYEGHTEEVIQRLREALNLPEPEIVNSEGT